MTWTLVVPWDAGRLSSNAAGRLHWRSTAALRRDARLAGDYAWRQAGCPKATAPVKVDILVRRGRKMDDQNIIGGLKAVFDGIFVNKLTPDDSSAWVSFGRVDQLTGRQWGLRPETVLTVTERELPAGG